MLRAVGNGQTGCRYIDCRSWKLCDYILVRALLGQEGTVCYLRLEPVCGGLRVQLDSGYGCDMIDLELRSELLAMKSEDEELHTELSNAGALTDFTGSWSAWRRSPFG
jgi:hypothetical protein